MGFFVPFGGMALAQMHLPLTNLTYYNHSPPVGADKGVWNHGGVYMYSKKKKKISSIYSIPKNPYRPAHPHRAIVVVVGQDGI